MYSGVREIFSRYWKAYGGLREVARSPYFHLAVFVLLPLTFHTWSTNGWWNDALSTLPNLLGFSLAGFAMFIGFGDERFRQILADPEENESQPTVYVALCSTFVHFIIVQIVALMYSLVAKSFWFYAEWMEPVRDLLPILNSIVGAMGYALFLYALTTVLAATMHVFRIASIYESYQRHVANSAPENTPHK